jgi:transcriptional regulator with XRE-family HTH domain
MISNSKYPKIGVLQRRQSRMKRETVIDALAKYGISISTSTLSNYEGGHTDTPASILAHLALIYKCSIEDLYDSDYKVNTFNLKHPNNSYVLSRNSNRLEDNFETQYDVLTNLGSQYNDYMYVILNENDPYLHLPKGTRLVVKDVEAYKIPIHNAFDYFLITMDIKENGLLASKTFLTKAKRVMESQKPKLVYYIDRFGQEAFMSEQGFQSIITGLVKKIIIDVHTKNTKEF